MRNYYIKLYRDYRAAGNHGGKANPVKALAFVARCLWIDYHDTQKEVEWND